jgi:nitrous oxidase accessory protein NosD
MQYAIGILSILLVIQMLSYGKAPVLAATDNTLSGSAGNSAMTTNPNCGQVVTGNVKLTSNLICNSDGLIVGGPDTKINLNGFSIRGPGIDSNKAGISTSGQENITIMGNGEITGFSSGIYISGSNNVLTKNVNISINKIAIYISGSKFSDINNNMLNNNTIAVSSQSSTQTSITNNLLSGNSNAGITFKNTVDSSINENNILNTKIGIFMDVQSSLNKVNFNNLFNNELDIDNANNLAVNINNNYFTDNNCNTSLPSGLCVGR